MRAERMGNCLGVIFTYPKEQCKTMERYRRPRALSSAPAASRNIALEAWQ